MKTCNKCQIEKENTEFYTRYTKIGSPYLDCRCKDCRCKAVSNHRKTSPTYKNIRKAWDLKHYYNITLEQYNQMLVGQDFKCKICKSSESRSPKDGSFAVDHCHTTGKVRGLLCGRCNLVLGQVEDSPLILEEAINYLRNAK